MTMRTPGNRCASSALVSATKRAIAEIGTEMSCLMFLPFGGLGFRDELAQGPQAARLRDRLRQRGVGREVPFDRLLRDRLQQRRRVRVALVVAQLQQRVVGRALGQRRSVRREVPLDQLQAQVGEQLEARQRRTGHRLRHVPAAASAASTERTASSAVPSARGSGKVFRQAAVITPSVPSAPMKRSRRS